MSGFSRLTGLAAALAMVLAGAFAANAFDDKVPTAKEVMGKLNKGPKALTPSIEKALNAGTPDWETVKKQADEFVVLAEALGKNTPKKGEAESWKSLTDAYLANAQALAKAVDAKDHGAAVEVHAKLKSACMACHKAHK